jgi:hypothetical protein
MEYWVSGDLTPPVSVVSTHAESVEVLDIGFHQRHFCALCVLCGKTFS